MKRLTPVFIILLLASLVACDRTKAPKPVSATKSASSSASTPSSQPGSPPMQKYVTDQAGFVLYMPQGWTAKEGAQGQTQTVSVGDPSGQYSVFLCYGPDPTRQDIMGLARFFAGAIIKQFSGAEIRKSMMSPDKKHVVFEGTYMDPQQRKKFFRAWVTGGDGTSVSQALRHRSGDSMSPGSFSSLSCPTSAPSKVPPGPPHLQSCLSSNTVFTTVRPHFLPLRVGSIRVSERGRLQPPIRQDILVSLSVQSIFSRLNYGSVFQIRSFPTISHLIRPCNSSRVE